MKLCLQKYTITLPDQKYQNNLSRQFIVFNSKIGITIKSMSRLHDIVLCLAEMISYMPDMVVS